MAGTRLYVESPTVTPSKFGLLSVADERPGGNGHWQQGIEYDSDNCSVTLTAGGGYCITPSGTAEVQTVSITGAPTGGSFTLTVGSQTTAPIVHPSTAASVSAALVALPNVEPGDITVTGTTPSYTLTFGGQYASTDVPQVTATGAFTGGTTPAITTATTTPGVRTTKTITSAPGYIDEDPFTVYLIRNCSPVGDPDAQERAMKMFNGSEQGGVEKGFWNNITASGSGGVDITPGTVPATLAEGVALLEQYASTHYGGVPTIHASRQAASLLTKYDTVERHGNALETMLGSKVAAGSGYGPNGVAGAAPGAGEAWLYVTGEVTLYRGVANMVGPFLQQDASRNFLNQTVVMVERTYLTSADCMIAATKAKLVA